MDRFFVLPERPALAAHLRRLAESWLPGVALGRAAGHAMLEALAEQLPPGVFLVHRDELPAGEPVGAALADGFGAAPDDLVVEVQLSAAPPAEARIRSGRADAPTAPAPSRYIERSAQDPTVRTPAPT